MATTTLSGHLDDVPDEVVEALHSEYVTLESRFARQDWDPARLASGKYAEALLRYLEWKQSGSHTPVGTQINRTTVINQVSNDASLPEGIRFLVRRCADLLLDVRNKRGVAHLGDVVDVEEMDARLCVRLASWSLAEVVREESDLDPEEVQSLIDRLSATHFPLVEEIEGELIVVAKDLTSRKQALVALYHAFPDPMPMAELQAAVKYPRAARFRKMMEQEADKGITHIKGEKVYLTKNRGVPWVEENIDFVGGP